MTRRVEKRQFFRVRTRPRVRDLADNPVNFKMSFAKAGTRGRVRTQN